MPKRDYEKPITVDEMDRSVIKVMLRAKLPIEGIYAYLKVGKLVSKKGNREDKRQWQEAIKEFRSLDR